MPIATLTRQTVELLEHVVEELDVPPSKYEDARAHYEAVGDWLGRDGSALAPFKPVVFPQGSFALGTAIKPVNGGDYDVDAVCLLSQPPAGVSQRWLKQSVGERLKAHDKYAMMLDPKEGGRRCWTLKYADGSQFHLDVLPAIPDAFGWLLALGVPERLAKSALKITDRDRLDDPDWPRSNPAGYAAWFRDRMVVALNEAKQAMASERKAEVVSIPDNEVRTPLQRVVQLLKRHRDVTFGCDPDRPISIIITTLAAHAYNNESDIDTGYRNIVSGMRQFVRRINGVWTVSNPVNPRENFADRWAAEPAKAEKFFGWIDLLERQLSELDSAPSLTKAAQVLTESFGDGVAPGAIRRFESAHGVQSTSRLIAASGSTESALDAPYRQRPPWPLSLSNPATLSGSAQLNGLKRLDLQTQPRLSRNVPLMFNVTTSAAPPFEVFWQVVNTGSEAAGANDLRGRFFVGGNEHGETTRYRGKHSIQAFIVKNGTCVARTNPIMVTIG